MPLITSLPDSNINTENNTLPIAIPELPKSTFTSLIPESKINSLLKYVEGYPWTVHYYGMILNENNTIEHFDPTVPNLTQSFYKVNNTILQVSSPLTSNYDSSTGITTISGSSITPYTFKPNVGDIFLAKVDSGEDAIFLVTSVTRKTYRKDTLYEISYSLYSYISDNPNLISTLNSRIQQEYYFNKDTNFFNRDLLVIPKVKEAIDRLKILLNETKHYYFSTFAQKEVGTIAIPGLDKTIYDPLLLNFIFTIEDTSNLVEYPLFRHNYLNDKYIDQSSLFDILIKRNINLISTIHKQYQFLTTSTLLNRSRLGSIFHTRANYILYPLNPNIRMDINSSPVEIDSNYILNNIKNTKNYFMPTINIDTVLNNNIYTKPLLHELFINNYYIVSENFYNYIQNNNHYNSISYIELLIYKFIKKEAIAKEDLVISIQSYMNWSLLHQLYLLPVMWLIIKANL